MSKADRRRLVIDPGSRSVSGCDAAGKAKHRFVAGLFGIGDLAAVDVELGELRTDEAGRLLVLGGHGRSASPTGQPLDDFADNDGWFDDTSDGPVRASVTLAATGEELEVDPSWVIVAPPDFAPTVGNVVTLLDVVEQAAADARKLPAPVDVSFVRDILPLLRRAGTNQWVDASAFRGHRRGDQDPTDATAVERRGDFSDQALLKLLADPDRVGPAAEARQRVLAHIRAPLLRAEKQATAAFMPALSGDGGRREEGRVDTWLTVTPRQYRRLELWADGGFAPTDPAALRVGARTGGGRPHPGRSGPGRAGELRRRRLLPRDRGEPPDQGTEALPHRRLGRGQLPAQAEGPAPWSSDRADGRAVAGRLRRVRGLLVAGAAARPRRRR